MSKAEAIEPQAVVNVPTPVGPQRFVKVKVLAESGLFKNGEQYDKGSELTLNLFAAENFVKAGDVEILEEVL